MDLVASVCPSVCPPVHLSTLSQLTMLLCYVDLSMLSIAKQDTLYLQRKTLDDVSLDPDKASQCFPIESVPLKVPFYRQSNSTSRGTDLVLFF